MKDRHSHVSSSLHSSKPLRRTFIHSPPPPPWLQLNTLLPEKYLARTKVRGEEYLIKFHFRPLLNRQLSRSQSTNSSKVARRERRKTGKTKIMSGRNLPTPTRMGLLLLLLLLAYSPSSKAQSTLQPTDGGIFLGSFRTRAHRVAGDVFLLTERIMEIRGYSYDGTAPVVYFWVCFAMKKYRYIIFQSIRYFHSAFTHHTCHLSQYMYQFAQQADTNPRPTRGGTILSDGSPTLNCATRDGDPDLPRAENVPAQRVEFPDGLSIRDFWGGSLSVWCERFAANFGDMIFPLEEEIDLSLLDAIVPEPQLECGVDQTPPIARTPAGYNCQPLNDDYQVRWQVDGSNLNVELVGRIPDNTYMGWGISGRTTETWMIGADAVIADYPNSGPRARDFFMDQRAQCNGQAGVCADTTGGFTSDISNVSGEKDDDFGLTLVRFT